MRKAAQILMALAILSCCGCSLVSVGYNYGDWYLRHKINDYTSFDAQQKARIHHEVDLYMQWHRNHVLPEYSAFLQNLEGLTRAENRVKTADAACIRNEIKRLYRTTVNPAIPPAAQILGTLDQQQIAELSNTFAEQNRKMFEESLSGTLEENLNKRAEGILDFVESLVGDLSSEQTTAIKTMSLRIPFASPDYLQHRAANQARLIAMLNGHAAKEAVAEFLYSWINTPEMSRTPRQQTALQSYESAIDELTVDIYQLLNERQKNYLREKIHAYIGAFHHLNPGISRERKAFVC